MKISIGPESLNEVLTVPAPSPADGIIVNIDSDSENSDFSCGFSVSTSYRASLVVWEYSNLKYLLVRDPFAEKPERYLELEVNFNPGGKTKTYLNFEKEKEIILQYSDPCIFIVELDDVPSDVECVGVTIRSKNGNGQENSTWIRKNEKTGKWEPEEMGKLQPGEYEVRMSVNGVVVYSTPVEGESGTQKLALTIPTLSDVQVIRADREDGHVEIFRENGPNPYDMGDRDRYFSDKGRTLEFKGLGPGTYILKYRRKENGKMVDAEYKFELPGVSNIVLP